jgi:ElaB/YqjD/DUF883 family membrane-anchored ribosome-binding protein
MRVTSMKSAIDAGQRAVQDLASSKAVSDALVDGTATMKKLWKQTCDRADDLMYEAGRSIKRSPMRAVAMAFGAGALLGLLIAKNGRR